MILEIGYVSVAFTRDAPELELRPTDSASASVPARSTRRDPSGARGVLELYRAVGGLPQRAVVGGQLGTAEDGRTSVQVRLANPPDNDPETPTYGGAFDHDLVPGLPSEFAGAVLNGGVSQLWSAGTLVIDRGAYDPVESSEAAFTLATSLLVVALRLGHAADDEAVADALRVAAGRVT